MIHDHVGGTRDALKQDLALEFCGNKNKVISILIETHTNHDQIHQIRIIGWVLLFSLLEIVTQKNCLSCFIWVWKVGTNPKERFVSFKVTPSNDRVLCVYAPSGYSIREQLAKGHFFEGLQNYMEIKIREMKTK